jgi:hypothetical protein
MGFSSLFIPLLNKCYFAFHFLVFTTSLCTTQRKYEYWANNALHYIRQAQLGFISFTRSSQPPSAAEPVSQSAGGSIYIAAQWLLYVPPASTSRNSSLYPHKVFVMILIINNGYSRKTALTHLSS